MRDQHDGFNIQPSTNPTSAEARTAKIADPGFGNIFTDHMAVINYSQDKGWHDARIVARGPLSLDPATAVLHYAQEIFEGMKAYRLADGSIGLFRPQENAARFNLSADRMAMPQIDENLFIEAIEQLVKIDMDWFPNVDGGSLYLRPFMFASEVFLGVRPAKEYMFIVIASPVGAYFKKGADAVTIWASENYSRAAKGGTGAAKCGGNYAASLIAQAEAAKNGCDQVVFFDAAEHEWVEELGGMNLFFIFDDGSILTPPLSGTILPGITRKSILQLAKDQGLRVREERYSRQQWEDDSNSGKLLECFACGTAAVVSAVGKVKSSRGEFTIGNGSTGQMTVKLRQLLVDIQRGNSDDSYGWVKKIT
ncbi:branched-chain amino acid aminotransferase [Sphingorhabdus lutea]|uniref:branched-chain amino acid aminotransferase n=1 Tax=Sphingorhabdus lutea TaxID=1913578 RepID=UPI000AD1F2AC|nr:branched-chain amino acid aminotransferase [Sphingorhabdus lutea]